MTLHDALQYVLSLVVRGELHGFEAQALLDEPRPDLKREEPT